MSQVMKYRGMIVHDPLAFKFIDPEELDEVYVKTKKPQTFYIRGKCRCKDLSKCQHGS